MKKPGKKATAKQRDEMRKLERAGVPCHVVNDREDVKKIMDKRDRALTGF